MDINWKTESSEHFEKTVMEHHSPLYTWFLRDVENAVKKPLTGLDILDIGCGPGFMLEQFKNAGANTVSGLDISQDMLRSAEASGRGKDCLLTIGDSAFLPYSDNSFDVVFSRGSVFFWHDLQKAFESVYRVLKSGGTGLIGGGYGLSTPQEIVDEVKEKQHSEGGSSIKKLDPGRLVETAQSIGGNAVILSAPKRGFWVFWRK